MPDIRVALLPNTHRDLKMLAAEKGMTLSGVVLSACIQYINSQPKVKPLEQMNRKAHSPKRNGKRS